MSGYSPTNLSGGSGDGLSTGQPPSFKTNVNRQKTKRWVNAKSYSYDGDDWGDDDGYENEEPAAPLVTIPDEAEQPSPLENQKNEQNNQDEIPAQQSTDHGMAPTPLQFIRPADIYKRMEEERRKENQEVDQDTTPRVPVETLPAATPADIASKVPVSVGNPQLQQSLDQSDGLQSHSMENRSQSPGGGTPVSPTLPVQGPPTCEPADWPTGDLSTSKGQDSSGPNEERQEQQPRADNTELHHNSSLGFRSVVRQAFDARLEAPITTSGSILRSDSASTSVISPIIQSQPVSRFGDEHAQGPSSTDQSPTVDKEPADFKHHQRRSLSPPSSRSSPARKPIAHGVSAISTHEAKASDTQDGKPHVLPSHTASDFNIHKAAAAQSSFPESAPTVPKSDDQRTSPPASPDVLQQPTESPTVTLDTVESPQMPSALNVGSGEKRLSLAQYDRPAPGNVSPSSPENVSLGVNDRLRDEIMRSLTPRASIDSQGQAHAGGGSNPSLEAGPDNPSSEGLGTAASPSNLPPQTPDMQSTPVAPSFPGLGSEHNSDISGQKEPAKTLKKRFSWEESSVEDNTQDPQEHQQLTIDQATASDTTQPSLEEKTPTGPVPVSRGHDEQDPERSASTTYSQAALTLSPTRTEVIPSQNVAEHETKSVQPPDSLLLQPAPAASSPSTLVHPQPASHPPATQDPKLLGFRQIMAIEKPGDKIKTFERTRKQFADMDTGLSSWIKATASSNPDHEDLAQRNGRLPPGTTFTHRPSTSRNKFPKLTSLGPLSLPTSHHEGSPMTTPTSAAGNTRHGSNANQFATKINTQQVQAKGKDLLHTAGVLGGKAGGAAKGLFAKGRSKFRNSSSTDKVDT
ncbi:hypothetical protein I7I50_07973 [Histoplasma capsulatum G186AR]|uniref:Uncharacterized protein n=1 Tax=Ajellomyces capsulatus TaxID=5037 RepID=A0A8H8CVE2_AJECA|nr:hypothetical protein I7I52_08489 [Histoplasma capsulatum]QSS68530.1 hypothetical protein I7I50_07973 [Histoplasma capsulatum G186AR]